MSELSHRMEFDHPIRIGPDGSISDAPSGIFAPGLYDEELDSAEWELITSGYTGQSGYSGPIMHNSESIGGNLERDILSEPGIYVALVCYWSPEDEEDETDCEGWAIARYVGPEIVSDLA